MSFRMKVLFWNMLLISIAFGISGYLLMNRSFQISMEREVEYAMNENQLIQAGVESELANRVLQDSFLGQPEEWQEIGESVMVGLQGTGAWFQIMDAEELLFSEAERQIELNTQNLTNGLEEGRKQYVVYSIGSSYYVASAGRFTLAQNPYYVINQRDISFVYSERDLQVQYYRFLMIGLILVCGLVMSVIAGVLTRPIRRLKRTTGRIAEGNYQTRARIRSQDEIGDLARDFNAMAAAVQDNVHALEEENRRKEEFVANFTHELKTPLTSVIGYAEMLSSQSLSPDDALRAANYIFHEGVRLESMSMKLFELFLLNQEELSLVPLYVPDFMESVRESAGPLVEASQMQLMVTPASAVIRGDGTLLKTVFINMIDNARKASEPGARIWFRANVREAEVLLEVRDEGCGIPAEDLHKITEAFYMVDKSRSREKGGAGLGLSLAARILEKHGAKLSVDSTVGQGTTMRVRFSLVADEEESG